MWYILESRTSQWWYQFTHPKTFQLIFISKPLLVTETAKTSTFLNTPDNCQDLQCILEWMSKSFVSFTEIMFDRYIFFSGHVSKNDNESPPPLPESKRPPPKGYVNFKVNERPARVAMWLNQNFLLNDDEIAPDDDGNLPELKFLCLRNKPHEFHFKMESDTTIHIKADDMDFCGEIVQSLAEYLGMEELTSTCDFPDELVRVEQMLLKADELQSVRQRLSTEMADQSGLIRSLVVRAEDSRLMLDLKNMKKWYNQLYDINQDLVSGYKIRVNNNQELMDTLKDVNLIIQRAGRLRGKNFLYLF